MKLNFEPITDCLDLVAYPAQKMAEDWEGTTPIRDVFVAEIDPKYMGGANFCEYYGISEKEGANCIIIEAVRGKKRVLAACLVPVDCEQADFNGVIRKRLNARRVSLAPLEMVLKETKMEYGSITVFGLPRSWPILIEPSIVSLKRVIIGSGLQRSKIALPGEALLELPNAQSLKGICKKVTKLQSKDKC